MERRDLGALLSPRGEKSTQWDRRMWVGRANLIVEIAELKSVRGLSCGSGCGIGRVLCWVGQGMQAFEESQAGRIDSP